jgi:hypothetical protein
MCGFGEGVSLGSAYPDAAKRAAVSVCRDNRSAEALIPDGGQILLFDGDDFPNFRIFRVLEEFLAI